MHAALWKRLNLEAITDIDGLKMDVGRIILAITGSATKEAEGI